METSMRLIGLLLNFSFLIIECSRKLLRIFCDLFFSGCEGRSQQIEDIVVDKILGKNKQSFIHLLSLGGICSRKLLQSFIFGRDL
jgi:hypothetical protein